jgi:hypothetical protein
MTRDVTAQPLFDGTFSSDAVASAAHALVAQLHDEAMATIAELAEGWDRPAGPAPVVDDEPVTYCEPATWSVVDDEEDDVVPLLDLPALLPRPRPAATNVTARVDLPPAGSAAVSLATAATDEFAAVEEEREFVAL